MTRGPCVRVARTTMRRCCGGSRRQSSNAVSAIPSGVGRSRATALSSHRRPEQKRRLRRLGGRSRFLARERRRFRRGWRRLDRIRDSALARRRCARNRDRRGGLEQLCERLLGQPDGFGQVDCRLQRDVEPPRGRRRRRVRRGRVRRRRLRKRARDHWSRWRRWRGWRRLDRRGRVHRRAGPGTTLATRRRRSRRRRCRRRRSGCWVGSRCRGGCRSGRRSGGSLGSGRRLGRIGRRRRRCGGRRSRRAGQLRLRSDRQRARSGGLGARGRRGPRGPLLDPLGLTRNIRLCADGRRGRTERNDGLLRILGLRDREDAPRCRDAEHDERNGDRADGARADR